MNPILIDIPVPILTPRLLIRQPLPGDGPSLDEAIRESQGALKTYMAWARGELPPVADREVNVRVAHAKWLLREDLRMPFFDRQSGRFLGSSGLHRIKWEIPAFEIGYWVRTSATGKGYVTEATNALTVFAFKQLKAKRVDLRCNAENRKSIAVAERLGFELEGRLRMIDEHVEMTNPCRDTLVFSRLNLDGLPPLEVSWPQGL